ncbi:MAG: peptidoglycan bridge formation glycyltransferase FemA/FemB family protein [Erysipelotrichaceae bacterium]|nr:peptidoglycan bridge formation glycyltransferase FemA/FemB family protein [Erysipelotrichaceae bacterium]
MQIEIISEDVYKMLEKENSYMNFQQTVAWAKVKASTGWKPHYFACRYNDNTYTWLVLEKIYMKVFKVFYSQKGLAIDYENEDLVKEVYWYMKDWIRKEKGTMLIIDPNITIEPNVFKQIGIVPIRQIVPNAKDVGVNCYYVKGLKSNYKEVYEGFGKRNKGSIKKSKRYVWNVEILERNEIERFYEILQHTAERSRFSIRSIEYFRKIYDVFKEKVIFIVLILDVEKSIEQLKLSIENHTKKLSYIKSENKRIELIGQIKQCEKEIERLSAMECYVDVCSAMYILDKPKELIHVFGGNVKEYMDFEGQFYLHDYMMRYAANEGYTTYNFYGCENNGVFLEKIAYMKEGFCGKYVKTIGDYLLVNSKWKTKWFYRCRCIYLWIRKYI